MTDTDLARRPAKFRHVAPRPATFAKPKPIMPAAQRKAVRKALGVRSLKSAAAQGALAKRASKPGHFRAKAILAAQNGNTKAAKRFEAKRVLAKAKRKPAAFRKPKRR